MGGICPDTAPRLASNGAVGGLQCVPLGAEEGKEGNACIQRPVRRQSNAKLALSSPLCHNSKLAWGLLHDHVTGQDHLGLQLDPLLLEGDKLEGSCRHLLLVIDSLGLV